MNTKERLGRIAYQRKVDFVRSQDGGETLREYDNLSAERKNLYGAIGLAVWQECVDEFTPAIAHYNVCKLKEATLAVALDKVKQ